jgi:hypothetical protein
MIGTGFEVCLYHDSLNFKNSGFRPRMNYGTFLDNLILNFDHILKQTSEETFIKCDTQFFAGFLRLLA